MKKDEFTKKLNQLVNSLNGSDFNYCECGTTWSRYAKGELYRLCVQLDGFTADIMSSIDEDEITIELVRIMSVERAIEMAQNSSAFEHIVIEHDRGSPRDADGVEDR